MLGESPIGGASLGAEGSGNMWLPITAATVAVTATGVLSSAKLSSGSATVSVTSTAWLSPSIAHVTGSIALPAWIADGEISESDVSGTVTLSQWTAAGWVGVRGQPELPEWTAAGSVTTPGWVTGSVELSEWTASGTIQTQTIARASVTLPVWTVAGNTGAVAEVTFPVWTASGTVGNPAVISGTATLPRWVGTGTITTGSIVSGAVTLSAWTADGEVLNGSWVTGTATLPAWTAYGHLAGATTETTYAINLSTGAVTQLLLGAFDKLVTAHGRLYGLRDGALIRLDGDDDSGTAIAATIRFAPQQFGTYLAKRLDGVVYLNTREDDGVTLTLVQDEVASWTYQTSTDASPGMGTHRVKVGRGITFHSLGLVLENRDGGRLDVGGLEIPVYPLSRRPR